VRGEHALRVLENCAELLEDPHKDAYRRLAEVASCVCKLNHWDFPEELQPSYDRVLSLLGIQPSLHIGSAYATEDYLHKVLRLSRGQLELAIQQVKRLKAGLEEHLLRQKISSNVQSQDKTYLY
jgi:hypothetical protein